MLVVNLILAFVPSVTLWIAASQLLASFIYRTEMRRPGIQGSTLWYAAETLLVFLVFAGSVGAWAGLTILLQHALK